MGWYHDTDYTNQRWDKTLTSETNKRISKTKRKKDKLHLVCTWKFVADIAASMVEFGIFRSPNIMIQFHPSLLMSFLHSEPIPTTIKPTHPTTKNQPQIKSNHHQPQYLPQKIKAKKETPTTPPLHHHCTTHHTTTSKPTAKKKKS